MEDRPADEGARAAQILAALGFGDLIGALRGLARHAHDDRSVAGEAADALIALAALVPEQESYGGTD